MATNDEKIVKKGMAKNKDTKGGKDSMERINPVQPDCKPQFKGITHR